MAEELAEENGGGNGGGKWRRYSNHLYRFRWKLGTGGTTGEGRRYSVGFMKVGFRVKEDGAVTCG
jgi:hypothetical protein